MIPMTLETDRLLLRQWVDADLGPFAALNGDARVMAHFPSVLTPVQSDALANHCRALMAAQGWGVWAIEHKVSGQFIGMAGLHIPSPDLPFSPCVEVAWRLGYDYWGHGYATEAATAAIDTGFGQLDLAEVVAFTTMGNVRSQAVMQRLGMVRLDNTFLHPDLPVGHAQAEHCLYRLSKEAWDMRKLS